MVVNNHMKNSKKNFGKSNKLFKSFTCFLNIQKLYEKLPKLRTDRQTDRVTSSLLELLVAAKNRQITLQKG